MFMCVEFNQKMCREIDFQNSFNVMSITFLAGWLQHTLSESSKTIFRMQIFFWRAKQKVKLNIFYWKRTSTVYRPPMCGKCLDCLVLFTLPFMPLNNVFCMKPILSLVDLVFEKLKQTKEFVRYSSDASVKHLHISAASYIRSYIRTYLAWYSMLHYRYQHD